MEIVLRSSAIFFFIWLLTRAMGKRELAQMTAFELILLVTIGDLVQQAVTQEDMSVVGAILSVGTIGAWILIFSYLTFRWRKTEPHPHRCARCSHPRRRADQRSTRDRTRASG